MSANQEEAKIGRGELVKNQPVSHHPTSDTLVRMRLTYKTSGGIRYTGNLDLHRIWERAFRRANLPISYSNGFHPQPRLHLACALPLGMISHHELADLWMDDIIPPEILLQDLNNSLPNGIRVISVEQVDLKEKALQTRIKTAIYQVSFDFLMTISALSQAVEDLLSSSEIIRERRGKTYNLKPLIEKIEVQSSSSDAAKPVLVLELSAREGATGRPEEVLSAMNIDPLSATTERISLTYD